MITYYEIFPSHLYHHYPKILVYLYIYIDHFQIKLLVLSLNQILLLILYLIQRLIVQMYFYQFQFLQWPILFFSLEHAKKKSENCCKYNEIINIYFLFFILKKKEKDS